MTHAHGELVGFAGPFFTVDVHVATESPTAPWQPLSVLVDGSGALAIRIGAVQAALGLRPDVHGAAWRVAASVTHLGLAARLLAPVLGAAVSAGRPLEIDLDRTWWQDELGGAFPLSIPFPDAARDAAPDAAAEAPPRAPMAVAFDAVRIGRFVDQVIDTAVRPLVEATAVAAALSPRILWGNAASAVNGAAAMMAREQPQSAPGAYRWARAVLAHPRLAGETSRPGPGFRRRSCCLIYRAAQPDAAAPPAPGRTCGDCVLGAEATVVSGSPR